GAGRIELELEAATARRRIDAECHRAALVTIGIGDLPGGTDEVLGKVTDWWCGLRRRLPMGKARRQRQSRQRHDPPKPDDRPHGERLARRQWRRHGAVYVARGRHGVSGTGVSGGLPAAQAKRLSTTSWSIWVRV